MKKLIHTFPVILFIAVLSCFLLTACGTSSETASAKNGAISIQNTTGYALKNTTITFNQESPVNVDALKTNDLASVDLPSDTFVTTVHISGEASNGQIFSNTFSGLITNQSILNIYLDDDMNINVSSNIDA